MDCEIIDIVLPIEQIGRGFREAIDQRPAIAKINRTENSTPSIGPSLGFGGIADPDHAIGAKVQPLGLADSQVGGANIILAKSHGDGSRVIGVAGVEFDTEWEVTEVASDRLVFKRRHEAERVLAGLKASCDAVPAS